MFMTRSEYDRGVNTFSPEGRIFQVEYAIEAIKLGSTAIGIQTSEGVVLAVEKRITSPLIEPKSIEKIFEIDKHVGKLIFFHLYILVSKFYRIIFFIVLVCVGMLCKFLL